MPAMCAASRAVLRWGGAAFVDRRNADGPRFQRARLRTGRDRGAAPPRAPILALRKRLDQTDFSHLELEGNADGDQRRRPPRGGGLASSRSPSVLRMGRSEIANPYREGDHRQGL